jgi:ABC transport system ATP-binding/permease protein
VFLDNVVTSVFVLDGSGKVEECVGGYSDWQRQKQDAVKTETNKKNQAGKQKPDPNVENLNAPKNPSRKKLSFKEQQELSNLPELIAKLEAKQAELSQKVNSAGFYKKDPSVISAALTEVEVTDTKLEQAYRRWDELETLQSG